MKTEATRPPETADRSRSPDEPHTEATGRSFPEILGQTSAASAAAPDTGLPSIEHEAAGSEGGGTDGFALAATLATEALVASQALATRRGGAPSSAPSRGPRADPLDPATRQVAQLGPPLPMATPVHGDAPVLARAHASLEDVLPAIVRRIAWAGDGRKGSLRLEFGAGALAGGTLVVHADDGRVKVELRAPPGTDAAAWRDRIAARLEEKRIRVDEIVVE
jgi:hypothetical protein